MNKKKYAALLFVTLLLGSVPAFAQFDVIDSLQPPPPPPMQRECGPPLPPEIRVQVDQLREDEQERALPIRHKLMKSRHALRRLIDACPHDEAAISARVHEQAQLQAELLVLQIRTQSRIRALLDAGKPPEK